MEFGSKFVFNYSDSEEEVVSDEEYEMGFTEDAYDIPSRVTKQASVAPRSAGVVQNAAPPVPSRHGSSIRSSFPRILSKAKVPKKHHWQSDGRNEKKTAGKKGARKYRRADTNVMSVKFGHLTSAGNMHTGDPVYCQQCAAVLSCISKLEDKGEDMVWACEYCSAENIVDIMSEEVPSKDDITFMLLPAPSTTAGGRLGLDEMMVVFCIDMSGSMCVTTEVPGKVKLRGDRLDRLQSLNTGRESQYLPGQQKNTTFVSRLQGVQAAVDYQLSQMSKEHPDRKVALVTFNNEVTSVGDGSAPPVHFSGDKLKDWDSMKTSGEELALPQAVKLSRRTLSDKLFDLEEGGQTALGPALLLSVAIASQISGSKVIICTDGMANVGLGTLDNINKGEDLDLYHNASSFYQEVSQFATDKGVSVSVTTIKGTDCKLMELGQVASNTRGQVNIVDPLKLTEEFGNILADATIATNVEATIVLHKGLYFRNEDYNSNKVTRQIGNVNKDAEVTFAYGIRRRHSKKKPSTDTTIPEVNEPMAVSKDEEASKPETETAASSQDAEMTKAPGSAKSPVQEAGSAQASGSTETSRPVQETEPAQASGSTADGPAPDAPSASSADADSTSKSPEIDNLQALPFQVQIRYTDTDGGQAMRVITKQRPITKKRTEAEKEMNPLIMGVHGAKRSAFMAMEGDYGGSRLTAFMHQRLMYRNIDVAQDCYDIYLDNVRPMENALLERQKHERSTVGHTYSDSEDSDEEFEGCEPSGEATTTTTAGVATKRSSVLGRVMSHFVAKEPPKEKQSKLKKKAQRRMECPDESSGFIYKTKQASSTSENWKSKDKK